ncbi:MAG: hypothetical protein ACFFD1_12095 [Candidatus Thorarchaeota archaeon]
MPITRNALFLSGFTGIITLSIIGNIVEFFSTLSVDNPNDVLPLFSIFSITIIGIVSFFVYREYLRPNNYENIIKTANVKQKAILDDITNSLENKNQNRKQSKNQAKKTALNQTGNQIKLKTHSKSANKHHSTSSHNLSGKTSKTRPRRR